MFIFIKNKTSALWNLFIFIYTILWIVWCIYIYKNYTEFHFWEKVFHYGGCAVFCPDVSALLRRLKKARGAADL